MATSTSARIHPSAHISPDASIGENVEIGANAVLEGKISIGADCVIRPGAYLFGPLKMGSGNSVYTGAVLGERPQHLRYNDEPTSLEIGDNNIFREHCTIHRGTTANMKTVIGNSNFFMVNSHIAHDCIVGNSCFLTNGSLVAGHCVLGDNVYLSGNSAIHQFIHVGRLAMLSGCSTSTKDIPPFIVQENRNNVVGVNVIGMRRAGMTPDDISAVKQAFRIIYRSAMVLPAAVDRLERDLGNERAVREMLEFIATSSRGINLMRGRRADAA